LPAETDVRNPILFSQTKEDLEKSRKEMKMLMRVEAIRHTSEYFPETDDLSAPFFFHILCGHGSGKITKHEIHAPIDRAFFHFLSAFQNVDQFQMKIDLHAGFQKGFGLIGRDIMDQNSNPIKLPFMSEA